MNANSHTFYLKLEQNKHFQEIEAGRERGIIEDYRHNTKWSCVDNQTQSGLFFHSYISYHMSLLEWYILCCHLLYLMVRGLYQVNYVDYVDVNWWSENVTNLLVSSAIRQHVYPSEPENVLQTKASKQYIINKLF